MTSSLRILKNSLFLALEPLFMNVVSLFVVGYMARKLGTSDFGIFNFSMAFMMLFYPFAAMGFNRVMIRDMAGLEDKAQYAGRMVTIRFLTTLFSVIMIIGVCNILGYPLRTTYAIYLASCLFLFQQFSECLTDIFNTLQRMEFTALVQLVSGLTLTLLSVIVLYLGCGLYEVIEVYALGHFLGLAVASFILVRFFFKINMCIDWQFIREKTRDGFYFFLMTMMWFAMMRLDTVLLSKKIDMAELGLYTAAVQLVVKLTIIPQAVASSLLPALSGLYARDKADEASGVISFFMTQITLLSLPLVILVFFFSEDIVTIVFGEKFRNSAIILRIGIWVFMFRCIAFVESSILIARQMHLQMLKSYGVATVFCILSNVFLIYQFGSLGAISAFVSTQFLLFILFTFFTWKAVHRVIAVNSLTRIVMLNCAFALFVYTLRYQGVFLVVPLAAIFYVAGAQILGLLRIQDLTKLKTMLRPAA